MILALIAVAFVLGLSCGVSLADRYDAPRRLQ